MQLGMIGLGRMGGNMVRRLIRGGHECVVFDMNPENVKQLASEGAKGTTSLDDFVRQLHTPRTAWVMVPAGEPTERTVMALAERMEAGDIIVDGGNSYFKDDVRRARSLREKGMHYVDVGTSGGIWGIERGYCLMIGGAAVAVKHLDPIFKALAPGRGITPHTPGREHVHGTAEEGYLHCSPAGAGHFVKMVHNGIEYGLMQAYAEGFDIFRNANSTELPEEYRYDLNLADIAELWRRGSVVGSWLLDLMAIALAENPSLSDYTGYVQDSGEGRWTILAAVEEAVPAEVLSASLYTRFRSRQEHTFAEKVLSAIFGIYRRATTGPYDPAPDLNGSQQVAAGYVMYGPGTVLVYTSGNGVNGFTLDDERGAFVLSHQDIHCPVRGRYYSANLGHSSEWHPHIQQFVAYLTEPDHATQRPYSLWYTGALVADMHRTLLEGGLHFYPPDAEHTDGKLRLLYECAPLAFIAECCWAWGRTDTRRRCFRGLRCSMSRDDW